MNNSKITMDFFNKFEQALKSDVLFKKDQPILLAVSGGPHSMAMLYCFAKKGYKVIAAHFNHGIRGALAYRDEKFVSRVCFELSIPFVCGKADVPNLAKKRRESLEQAARRQRYLFLEKTALKYNCSVISTAHHADDNAETFLINLLRGKNLKGLTGIPVKRRLPSGIYVFRPLLGLSRKEIEIFLKANKVDFVEDETNEDEKYLRNWIRKTVIPLLESKQPKIRQHINCISWQIWQLLSCGKKDRIMY